MFLEPVGSGSYLVSTARDVQLGLDQCGAVGYNRRTKALDR